MSTTQRRWRPWLVFVLCTLAVVALVWIVATRSKPAEEPEPRKPSVGEYMPSRTPWDDETTSEVFRDAGKEDSWRVWAKVLTQGVDAGSYDARRRALVTLKKDYMKIVRACYKQEGSIGGQTHITFDVEPSGQIKSVGFTPAFSTHLREPACLSAVPKMSFAPADYAMRVTVKLTFDPRGSP
jgi:hypothetical protein